MFASCSVHYVCDMFPPDTHTPRRLNPPGTIAAAVLLAVMMVLSLTMTSTASADVTWFWTDVGTTGVGSGQAFTAVNVKDQSGTQDSWQRYVEFIPDGNRRHVSAFLMDPDGSGDTLTIDLNYRGPNGGWSLWDLALVDHSAPGWATVSVFDNRSMPSWVWAEGSIVVADASRFVDTNGHVTAIWGSNDGKDVTQLDHLKLTLSGTTDPDPDPPTPPTTATPPPSGVNFDYQIGGDRTLDPAENVGIVSRDWFASDRSEGLYNICYVNAFQTQGDDPYVNRIDETGNWPAAALLPFEDPEWAPERIVDLRTAYTRELAAQHVYRMIDGCSEKGYDAVEFDNLDTYTRLAHIPTSYRFYQADAIDFAIKLVDYTHGLGMAAAQKNTAELIQTNQHGLIDFDFAVVEQCGFFTECDVFADAYDDNIVVVEYDYNAFQSVCSTYSGRFPTVFVDRDVTPGFDRSFC